ncbi:MAG: extracellular solute-binding protein [Clostridia bacterium]|nr:extracellular solute-binding protein [Clostridia bacterium]
MRSSTTAKVIAVVLATLMLIPTGVAASSTDGSTSKTEKTTMDEVKEYLYSEDYFTYKTEKDAAGWKDAAGSGVTVKAAEGYEYEPDASYPDFAVEVMQDPEKGAVLHMPEAGTTSWKVNIPSTGYYVVRIEYKPFETKSINTSNIKREFFVDGKAPFSETYYYEFTRKFIDEYNADAKREDGTQGFSLDKNDNEKKPVKNQVYEWSVSYLMDSQGFVLEPLKYALTEGEHTISFNATMNDIIISDIVIEPYDAPITYEEYLAAHGSTDASAAANAPKVQAETPTSASDLTIYAVNDRTSSITEPQHASKQLLNTIGGSKWQTFGQWIEWTIPGDQITESGYYYIVPRFKQAIREGLYVSRSLTINGQIPFENCNRLQFNYSDDWQCTPLNDGEQDLKFWFDAGKDVSIRMQVCYGNMADTLRQIQDCIEDMNSIYQSIIRITGPNPDEYTSYDFAATIYDSILLMRDVRDRITDIAEQFKTILGGKSASDIATLEKIAYLLDKMSSKESEIAKNLDNLKVNTGYLGTWIMNTKLQALTFDFLTLQPAAKPVKQYPKGTAGFWNAFTFEIKAFFASFFTDYNSLGSVEDNSDTEPVEVWISTSREEAQVMREMIDLTCPVKVNLKLVAGGTLLPATLAGDGPDISLAMGQSDVINYAIRSAVEPLYVEADGDNNLYSDYLDVCAQRFSDQALVGLRLENPNSLGSYIYYGMPERLGFSMLFYRKDIFAELDLEVPQTWQDLYDIVPTLQINYRKVGFPSSLGGLQMLMYQHDEDLYSDIDGDGVLDGMQINIDSKTSLQCFEELVTLFQVFKFPRAYDLATYFRMGEMPIAVADYLTYNQFTIYATELRGLWEFTLLPGTIVKDEQGNVMYDENGDVMVNSNAPCSVSATVLMRDKKGRSEELRTNCWGFMKWWTGAEAQSTYAKQYEAIVGMAAKFNTANTEALRNMSWTNSERKNLEAQFAHLKGTPEFPGGYIITRYVDFAFLNCYNNNADAMDSLLDQIQYINNELSRKRKEFGLITYEEYKEQNEEAHPEWFE